MLTNSTRRPASAARWRTCASFSSVAGHTSGQCVKPKNMSVGAPTRSCAVSSRPLVSVRRKSGRIFGCGSQVPLASCGLRWSSSWDTQKPASAAQAAAARSQRARSGIMSRLFHTRARAGRAPGAAARAARVRDARPRRRVTVRALIAHGAVRLTRARVFFGHGTDNAWDEAAALVLHALRLPLRLRGGPAVYGRRVGVRAQRSAHQLLSRRIGERIPAAYLTGIAWFAGARLHVDTRVLVPRSPLAELIERGFAPWIDPRRVRRVLDLGTGSGCIAIACARMLPAARVDALDISPAALAVARGNVRRLRLQRRVRLLRSDHFSALGRASYDIIVANPPYVGSRELEAL